MWVHLAQWIVGDGEIPELHPGDLLLDRGLHGACWHIGPARGSNGAVLMDAPDPSGGMTVHYEVTGMTVSVTPPSTVLIDVGPFSIVAEPNTHRALPAEPGYEPATEPWSPTFRLPEVGARVTVTATLQVMADYEIDDIGLPDVRRTWHVDGLQLQDRWTGQARRTELPAMNIYDPKQNRSAAYLLDLRPA